MTNPVKNTICLWFDRDAETAARFYAENFPNSSVGAVHRAPGDNPSCKEGEVLTVEFTVMGIPCIGLNGGPGVEHTWAFSFQVATNDQAETDRYWECHCRQRWQGERVWLVQGQMGVELADYADRPDESVRQPRPCCRQAGI